MTDIQLGNSAEYPVRSQKFSKITGTPNEQMTVVLGHWSTERPSCNLAHLHMRYLINNLKSIFLVPKAIT